MIKMLSRKHYTQIAKILHESHKKSEVVRGLSTYFGSDNPRFDEVRFKRAVKWGK